MTVTVVPDEGAAFEVEVKTRDIAAWERSTGKAFSHLDEDMKLDDMYELAYAAAVRLKLYDGTVEDFKLTTDIEFKGEDESPKAAGTRKAR
ncbi:hypothetical protein ACIA2T_19680 [Amycolatopsis japonica]|uniref:hypothetical protein n=1 Tax=Amycolatopsis japonica TaxID=208439 RepID=UPI00379F2831